MTQTIICKRDEAGLKPNLCCYVHPCVECMEYQEGYTLPQYPVPALNSNYVAHSHWEPGSVLMIWFMDGSVFVF